MTHNKVKGFTMSELMITLAIVAVLAGIALPGYFRTIEQSRSNEALTLLNIIHMGEKIYRINNNEFWNGGGNAGAVDISNFLNVDITPIFYTDIDFSGVGVNGYTVRVTRNNVQGGAGTKWYQYVWNHTNRTLTQSEGGAF